VGFLYLFIAKNIAIRREIKPRRDPKVGEYSKICLNAIPPKSKMLQAS
jgi:hypothetical protein